MPLRPTSSRHVPRWPHEPQAPKARRPGVQARALQSGAHAYGRYLVSVDSLLSRLAGVRRTAPGRYTSKCPAHKDRRASLSVRELDDGRVLVHCFAGCEVGAVLDACGLAFEDLYPPKALGVHAAPQERRPFSARELLDALAFELTVAWVILGDCAAGKVFTSRDRKRALVARDRCAALIDELRHVR